MKKITLTLLTLSLGVGPLLALPVGTDIDIELLAGGSAPDPFDPFGFTFIDTQYKQDPAATVTIVDPGMELQIDAVKGSTDFLGDFVPDPIDPSTSGFLAFDIHPDHPGGHVHAPGVPSVAGSTWIWLKWQPALAFEDVTGTFTLSGLPEAEYELLYSGNGTVNGVPTSGGNQFTLSFSFTDDGTEGMQALGLQINPVSSGPPVPDGGTTGALLGVAIGAMAFARRASRKR